MFQLNRIKKLRYYTAMTTTASLEVVEIEGEVST